MQPEATETASKGTPKGGGGGLGEVFGPGSQSIVLLGMMFLIFYFLLIRPQQKRQKETDAMLKALRKGDKVRTSGGIRGEILEVKENEVELLIADKVKINVLRSHIAGPDSKPPAEEKKGKGF